MNYNISSPVPQPYEFERTFDVEGTIKWLDNNWHISIYWSFAYISAIFCLKWYMKDRHPYDLRRPLIVWNLTLATFSMLGTLRMLPGFLHILKEFGLAFSVCDNVYGFRLKASLFWGWLFLKSKMLELGDTIFIILRKRKLIFLHWYHHTVTMVIMWYAAPYKVAFSHWPAFMNFTVHSFMYSYYALRSMDVKVPGNVAMFITTLQIVQMIVNLLLIAYIGYLQSTGYDCHFPTILYKHALWVLVSYTLLFCNYFYKTYVGSGCYKPLKNE